MKQRGVVDGPFLKTGNALVFKVLLPVMIFDNTRKFGVASGFDWAPVVFVLVSTLALYVLYWAVVARTVRERRDRGVMVQGLVRGNFVIYGTPLCVNLFGDTDEVRALTGIVAAVVVSTYNLISVIVLEYYGTNSGDGRVRAAQTARNIARNPLIIGAVSGIAYSFLKTQTGFADLEFADRSIGYISRSAAPVALLFLGGEFKFGFLSLYRKQAAVVNIVREVVAAAAVTALAAALGFRGVELGAVLCVFGSPIAVSSYQMAKMAGGNADLAAALVVTTTVVSCFTVFAMIAAAKAAGLF